MEEIKVGEYVRTKDGFIGKIYNENMDAYLLDRIVNKDLDGCATLRDYCFWKDKMEKYKIKKHSFNIKDLIEKGDFVNGYEVDDFDGYDEEGNYFENDLGIPIYDDANMDCIVEYRPIRLMEIKSIVTKEQFKAMEYEVK